MRSADFDYELPEASIAQEAIEPRDAARLLVARSLADASFGDLQTILHPGDLLVVNQTRVRAARLMGRKAATGGSVEVLLVRRLDIDRWEALVRPARRIRPGTRIEFEGLAGVVLTPPARGLVSLSLVTAGGDVEDVLSGVGEVPLPPYFHGHLEDPERYQTIFAKTLGSAAAPTAALHFTPRLVAALCERGVALTEVELDVGLDTFRPMTVANLADHEIHKERYRVPSSAAEAVATTRASGGRVVAVGTTVVRTLETAAAATGTVAAGEAESGLFITPGHHFAAVDAMITNFHAPRTTLIALIAAAMGPGWREAYRTALERGYRFLSFGDAMFIDRVGEL